MVSCKPSLLQQPVTFVTYPLAATQEPHVGSATAQECSEDSFPLLTPFSGEVDTPPELLSMTIRILETLVDASGVAPSALSPAGDALPPAAPLRLTLFHGLRPPPISVSAYVERIAKYSKCSPVCFVLALMYLQRAARADVAYLPTPLNVHRLVLTAVMLGAKFIDDHYYNNAYYAKIGGIGTGEMNRLEVEMLTLLDHRLFVSAEDVKACLLAMQAGTLLKECLGEAAAGKAAAAAAHAAAQQHAAASQHAALAAAAAHAHAVAATAASAPAKKRKSFSLPEGCDEKRRHSDNATHGFPVAAAAEGIVCCEGA